MHRLTVVLLAALDAAVVALAGLAAAFAPLLVLWLFAMQGGDTSGLWAATAGVWQLGHLVPLDVELPPDALAALGVPASAARFVVSLAPLAFGASTFIAAARSGARGVRAGSWPVAVLAGTLLFVVVATVVALTAGGDIASAPRPRAIVMPAAIFLAGAVSGALRTGLREGDGGLCDRLSDALDALPTAWRTVPRLAFLGAGVVGLGMTSLAGVLLVGAAVAGAGDAVALFQALHVDVFGATALFLAQLAYLPVLLVWAAAWLVGPGFAVGAGTAVAPAGTTLGVVPGIPVFGFFPEGATPLLLLCALLPVALGAFAGWIARAGFAASVAGEEHIVPRIATAAAIAVIAGAGMAVLSLCASGGIGPGRMGTLGPDPLATGLALGIEVLIGATVLLLAPVRREGDGWIETGDPEAKAEGSLSH